MERQFFYQGVRRLDWGFGNPNTTGALLAMLIVLVWGLAYWRRWGYWPALFLFTGLGVCLVHTMSRGGIVAAIAGLALLLWKSPRPWNRVRLGSVIVSVLIFASASIYLKAHTRFGAGIAAEDRSITTRLRMWRDVPAMMWDAPTGWGKGQASGAYTHWYQDPSRSETFTDLLNSHFTWMVEIGWLARFGYVAAWAVTIALCWPHAKAPWNSVLGGVVIACGTAAFFSHTLQDGWLWILPAMCVGIALVGRLYFRFWPSVRCWAVLCSVSALTIALSALVGASGRTVPIRAFRSSVIIGAGNPSAWVVVEKRILGERYGRVWRRLTQENPSTPTVGFVTSHDAVTDRAPQCLVLCGGNIHTSSQELQSLVTRSSKLILLNPSFTPEEIGYAGIPARGKALFGEFSQTALPFAWNDVLPTEQIGASGDYLAEWPRLIVQLME